MFSIWQAVFLTAYYMDNPLSREWYRYSDEIASVVFQYSLRISCLLLIIRFTLQPEKLVTGYRVPLRILFVSTLISYFFSLAMLYMSITNSNLYATIYYFFVSP